MMAAMGMVTPPGHETFTESDLAPPEWEVQARRRARVDRGATFVAVLALGLWCGGLVALGACAAPMVFGLTPYPFSADAMSAAFERFDGIALGCVVATLGAEVTRSFLDLRSPRAPRDRLLARARRYLGILAAVGAIVSGTMLTPEIVRLHKSGARRGVGPDGQRLAEVHKQAESLSKGLLVAAVVTIALHVATVRSAREDEDDDAAAPLPPGSRQ